MDVGGRVNASIKRKEKQFRKGGTNRLPDHGALKKENSKNMKLLGRGLGTETTQDVLEKGSRTYRKRVLLDTSGSPLCDYHKHHDQLLSGD